MRRLCLLLCAVLVASACSEPPRKEMDRAQGALDAARAAGGELYAPQAFSAASTTLQQSHDAVTQRDYRLALSLAVEAHDRAQTAAKEAADNKARARGEGERGAAILEAAVKELQAAIARAQAARVPAADLKRARAAAADATRNLQKARAMLSGGDYLGAGEALKGRADAIRAQMQAIEQAAAAKPQRRRS